MKNLYKKIVLSLIKEGAKDRKDFRKVVGTILSSDGQSGYVSNIKLRDEYDRLVASGEIGPNKLFEDLLVTKKMRTSSGVAVITVLTKPYSCPGQCIYCPTEVDVPKSYLSNEPAVMRAILNKYDPKLQVTTRLRSLARQGHSTQKVELIVIGGTFSALPRDYQEEYIKSLFDALNGFTSPDLASAQIANQKAGNRCVGLTLETRPDYINKKEAIWYRNLGATRVELGVQSIYDDVLDINLRGHKVAETVKATKILKDAGFKICWHLMPNLLGSSLDRDAAMFLEVFTNPDYEPDYIKIYPTMVISGTKLYDLWKNNEYQSYTNDELIDLICKAKKDVPYWLRIMRTIRDIPAESIASGSTTSNLRQVVLDKLKKEQTSCRCIRCREVGLRNEGPLAAAEFQFFQEEYRASEGMEYFLSYENKDRTNLISLLRLRLTKSQFIDELCGAAIIREVHTYGKVAGIGGSGKSQHIGFGKRLIARAEEIAKEKGCKKIAVISGVGVRDYYGTLGYRLVGTYMVKDI